MKIGDIIQVIPNKENIEYFRDKNARITPGFFYEVVKPDWDGRSDFIVVRDNYGAEITFFKRRVKFYDGKIL